LRSVSAATDDAGNGEMFGAANGATPDAANGATSDAANGATSGAADGAMADDSNGATAEDSEPTAAPVPAEHPASASTPAIPTAMTMMDGDLDMYASGVRCC
jgi:hypothetical protein